MKFYAHTLEDRPATEWEPLFTADCTAFHGEACGACESLKPNHGHLNKVAWWTAKFAEEMFPSGSKEAKVAREWGYLVGLWHDLGKFSREFQDYLFRAGQGVHGSEISGKVDHSTAGAQHSDKGIPLFGRMLAYLIAGHHSGIADGITDSDASLEKRLKKAIPDIKEVPPEVFAFSSQLPPLSFALGNSRSLAFLTRLLFSALVDADFLATEAFMSAERAKLRPEKSLSIPDLEAALVKFLDGFSRQATSSPVNRIRSEVLHHCRDAADTKPGFFSLTVPTGGGKTLSSLAFALKHARIHDLRRVIYVIPFTSIIEQNAAVFRDALAALGDEVVVEHHSNLDPDANHENTRSRLAAENWDARIIVTTNVQFFESLHSNRTSRCRKLHRVARSVVILDEAQSLPVEFLDPCLRSLEEMVNHYGASVVLCTATQPALVKNSEFTKGIRPPREIIPDPIGLYERLRRVQVTRLPKITADADLISLLNSHSQVLCIVNTRRHARNLFDLLANDESRFHLSALMCPEHRKAILERVKRRLRDQLPVRLVSTQLIEAGVDIDFPVVFRALAGLDSIAQAAGRCDREGKLTEAEDKPAGRLCIFEPEKLPPAGQIRSSADSAREVLASEPPDPLDLASIESYFRTHYWKHSDSMDSKDILSCWPKVMTSFDDLLGFKFKTCAEQFRLIDDYSEPIIVPYGQKGKELCEELRTTFDPRGIRRLARRLQRYTVNLPAPQHDRLLQAGVLLPLHDKSFYLLNSDLHYSDSFGLHPEPDLTLNPTQTIL